MVARWQAYFWVRVSRRDGWCINKCFGKLYRTFSLELWLCYLLKWNLFLQLAFNLNWLVRLYWMLEWVCAMSIYTEVSQVLDFSELDWACCSDVKGHIWLVKRQMSHKRLVRVVLGLKSPAAHVGKQWFQQYRCLPFVLKFNSLW